jgi:HAE1 family hydrophobic/amphiphilic exporter-1
MSISELFIRRPVMTVLVTVAIAAFGILAYRSLPISDLPNVDFPTISVNASLPGASPQTMASAVATPLERQFSTIAGIDNMTSSSSLGSTSITIQFALDRNIDAAAQDVQAAISAALRQLPPEIQPPTFNKVNPASSPILFYALTSPNLTLSAVDEIGETLIAQRLSMVDGVAQVLVYGAQKYAVRIQLDPTALAYRGIGVDEVASAVQAQNANEPSGVLAGRQTNYTLQPTGQPQDAAGFRALTIAYRNGAAVQLGALGRVLDDVQNNKSASWFDTTRAIVLAVQRQPGTNTVRVARDVRAAVDSMHSEIPGDVRLRLLFDRSVGIQESVNEVKFTLLLTLCLVVLVIFLFLRNLSATIIPSLALPMSILGTFAVMRVLGYSLDNLSLLALTLVVGFVVDDAIVMLENIVRHLEMGKPPLQAALDGSREVGFTIVSMTLSLVAVFIPLLFLSGIIGRLFREFAVTIAVAILVSGFVSLTLTPMLASRFLRAPSARKHGALYRRTEQAYDRLLGGYSRTLDLAMRHRRLMLLFSLLVLIGTGLLFRIVPKGFIPDQDTGVLFGSTLAAQGIGYEAMSAHQQQAANVAIHDPNVQDVMSAVGGPGGGGAGSSNSGFLLLVLKPRSHRVGAEKILNELRPKFARIPGINVFMQMPPAIQIGARASRAPYQFTLQSPNLAALYPAASRLLQAMQQLPMLQDVNSDLQLANPQISVAIDPLRAAAYGVTRGQIETALGDAYGSRQISTIYAPEDEYWVVMELLPEYQQDPGALGFLRVRSTSGALVPLNAVARLTPAAGPVTVNHSGQLPSVTISFNLTAGASLGDATAAIERAAAQSLPGGITTSFSGTAQIFQSTQAGLLALVVLAVFVIYIILGILYESAIHPITILSGLPFAAFGALLALLVFHIDLSLYAFVGIILLIGIVKKNAIMMIDFALEAERREHLAPAEAIVRAAHLRFRPIMMTTVAAIAGTLPVALATGAGEETRRPLGIAVVGGLLFSQLITLYVTPVFYTYLDELSAWMRTHLARRRRGAAGAGGEQLDLGIAGAPGSGAD